MKLMQDEKIILESDNKKLSLTTHRIRYIQNVGWGQTHITSMLLENLDACKMRHIVQKLWLYLAVLIVLIAGIVEGLKIRDMHPFVPSLILAVIFYFIFFITRKAVITLYAGDATADILTKGMSLEIITDFIDEVEKAKNKRYLLSNRSNL